jgi:hypothetical protein
MGSAPEERRFPFTGHGADHPFKGKALAGATLAHENEASHAAFFRKGEPEHLERTVPLSRKRKCVATGWHSG